MILTPASTRRSATAWAASAGTARTPTTISSSATTASSSAKSRTRRSPTSLADDLGIDVEDGDDLEAVVGEDVGAGDRLAEVAGAEEGDVVLARGAQDLADLRDQRVDVVADAALAELAEAGEIAADLGRVDVRVLGELLRGDRLPAHLPGLGQHLQVARQPRGDAEREPLAVDDRARRSPHGSCSPVSLDHRLAHSIEPRATAAACVEDELARRPRRRPRPPGSSPASREQRSSLSMSISRSSKRQPSPCEARRAPPAPRRRGGSRAASRAVTTVKPRAPGSGRRRRRGSPG